MSRRRCKRNERVIIMTGDVEGAMDVTAFLRETGRDVVHADAWEKIGTALGGSGFSFVLLDLDTLPVSNVVIRAFKRKFPQIPMLAMSWQNFHPDLKESLSTSVNACLSKPVDPDELEFWLENLHEGQELKWFTESEARNTQLAYGFNEIVDDFLKNSSLFRSTDSKFIRI